MTGADSRGIGSAGEGALGTRLRGGGGAGPSGRLAAGEDAESVDALVKKELVAGHMRCRRRRPRGSGCRPACRPRQRPSAAAETACGTGVPSMPTMPSGVALTTPSAPPAASSGAALAVMRERRRGRAPRRARRTLQARGREQLLRTKGGEREADGAADAAGADHATTPGAAAAVAGAVGGGKAGIVGVEALRVSAPKITVLTAPSRRIAGSSTRDAGGGRLLEADR